MARYIVHSYESWGQYHSHHPEWASFDTLAEARAYAAARPEPLVDITTVTWSRGRKSIATRRLVPHPMQAAAIASGELGWTPYDDLQPEEDASVMHEGTYL